MNISPPSELQIRIPSGKLSNIDSYCELIKSILVSIIYFRSIFNCLTFFKVTKLITVTCKQYSRTKVMESLGLFLNHRMAIAYTHVRRANVTFAI
jgi:hypothetical protein